jgi:hypothetical protein
MAKIIPSIEKAKQSRQPPTEGEIYLLEYLRDNFDPDADVYFQPCFDGDRPDIVIIKKDVGVIIIEVKDWDLDHYHVDSTNKWKLSKNNALLKSPFAQVFSYKKHLFEIHSNCLLERNLASESFYGLVKVYVYFHNASKNKIDTFYSGVLGEIRESINGNNKSFQQKKIKHEQYEKNNDFLISKKRQIERDVSTIALTKDNLKKIAFSGGSLNPQFDDVVYQEFIRLLTPPYHYANEGKELTYTKVQARLVESVVGARVKVCGIAGSGKTTVLAKRAVNAHKQHDDTVLILTFNLTLRMYIKDKINEVRADFDWKNFHIINYHKFITIILNSQGVDVEYQASDEDWEREYYSNASIFSMMECEKYKTIIVDEVQDYKPEWLRIVRDNFLMPDGEMVLFGDEKQNIYDRSIDGDKRSKIIDGFGRWEKLSKSFRYKQDSHIQHLATAFQQTYLSEKYVVDIDESYQPSLSLVGINAVGFYSENNVSAVAEAIIAIAKLEKIHPNDITIISSREALLQLIDFELRNGASHQERTITSFGSKESVDEQKMRKQSNDELNKKLRSINASKKHGFNLNSGLMKLSTIHSFKGFESPTVFLLAYDADGAEMIYTGLTRAKENIIVLLPVNSKYAKFFEGRLDNLSKVLDASHAVN